MPGHAGPIEIQLAERQMCKSLLELAKAFFADPKNQASYEAWLKTQEKHKEIKNV